MFRYSTGVPANPVRLSREHNNVDPVLSTEAITNSCLVSAWLALSLADPLVMGKVSHLDWYGNYGSMTTL